MSQTSSISFAAAPPNGVPPNAAPGAFALIADDETLPQVSTFKDHAGVTHTITVFNNAPLTGRLLRLGSALPGIAGAFALDPAHDLRANDMAEMARYGNASGKVKVFILGRAPLANAAAGDFSGPFDGPNQDIGASSSFCAITMGSN